MVSNKANTKNTNPYHDAHQVIEINSPTIVDGGAYEGEMTERFLNLFSSPTIHAFEPLPRHVDLLKKEGNHSNVEIHNCALGDSNCEVELEVNPKSNTSSVLETTDQFRNERGEHSSRPKSDYVPTDTVTVQQVRMDEIIHSCDIMKLDLQGYELNALHGAEKLLPECQAIITEVSFVPLYEDQTLFLELYQYLSGFDFKLYNLYVGHASDGQMEHGDALFLKKSVYEDNPSLRNWFSHS